MMFARPARMAHPDAVRVAQQPQPQQQPQKKVVDLKADIMYPIDYRDTSAVCLVGNVAFYHSGAVITCDSAVRYSEKHMECFGNVLINKNSTYVYGDRADYNGETHVARVYSDLIKVIDGEATLYTYKFLFNTKTNIGEYDLGGVVTNRENRLESDRGYYYADDRTVICVERVEIHSEEYDLTGDSVVYNLTTDHAYYFRNTNIWNRDGDYLCADRGEYEKNGERYTVTENGYILTAKQEVWSDSIDYYKLQGYAVLRNDIQIDDTDHKTLLFGDFGEYWKEEGRAFLTRRPSVVSYDTSQGDSLFMASDSMYLFTIDPVRRRLDSLRAVAVADSLQAVAVADSLARDSLHRDSLLRSLSGAGSLSGDSTAVAVPAAQRMDEEARTASVGDSLSGSDTLRRDSLRRGAADSLLRDSMSLDSLAQDTVVMTKQQRRQLLREAAAKEKAELKAKREAERQAELDTIAARRLAKTRAKLDAMRVKDSLRNARLSARQAEKEARRRARRGLPPLDSTALDSLSRDSLAVDSLAQDSLLRDSLLLDSLSLDSLSLDSLAIDSAAIDSTYRLVKAFRNVRIYRSDFQSVCDSLVAVSRDSTIHLYLDPVLWNQNSQVTSDVMDIYTANSQILRAEFVGRPLMISELDTMHYNQVAGKTMTALFRDNEIYRNDVKGNAQTIYFMQEDGAPDIIGLLVLESGDMTFYIEEKQVVGITYRNNPVYTIYPMDKIPPDVELFLKDFKWEAARRPTLKDVFDRTIRPSIRAAKQALARPQFPISTRIESYKKRLIETRRWSDRTDTVMPDVLEWMYSLGYRPEEEPSSDTEGGDRLSPRREQQPAPAVKSSVSAAGSSVAGDNGRAKLSAAALPAEGLDTLPLRPAAEDSLKGTAAALPELPAECVDSLPLHSAAADSLKEAENPRPKSPAKTLPAVRGLEPLPAAPVVTDSLKAPAGVE